MELEVVTMGERWGKRRSLRRAVGVDCSLGCDLWDGTVALRASDISNEGVWIDTSYPLEPGDEVVVALSPPGSRIVGDIWALAEVTRVGMWRRSEDVWPAGMALAFTYLSSLDRRWLSNSLYGHPPRLPGRRKPPPLPARAPIALSLADVTFLDAPPQASFVALR